MKIFATFVAAAAVSMTAGFASAATFDFEALADSSIGEGSWESRGDFSDAGIGDFDDATDRFTVDGIWVEAVGTDNFAQGNDADYHAYLDAGNAGLGVCKVTTVAHQCTPGDDDNLSSNEALILNFSTVVQLTDIFLRTFDHSIYAGAPIWIRNMDTGLSAYRLPGDELTSLGSSTSWLFETNFQSPDLEDWFYISSLSVSQVPLPAGALLLLTGLGGLAVARRRKS